MHHLALFIRRTITNSRKTAQPYYTHRLVEGVRTGRVVKQVTRLNLGSEFDVAQSDWPLLVLLCHKFNFGLIQLQCGQCPRALASATLKRSRKVVIESGM